MLKRIIMPQNHTGNRTDAFIRWRFKNSFARVEPPSDGKKRLLQAAYAETKSSDSQYSHLNTLIETEQYQDQQVYLAWVLASRFHMALLSSIKMR